MYMNFIVIPILITSLKKVKSEIIQKVNQGQNTSIEPYAHSVFLYIGTNKSAYVCGGSIVNQKIILTAAHCLSNCKSQLCQLDAHVGSANREHGTKYKILHYMIHKNYNRHTVSNDIAVALLKREMTLGTKMKRVALTSHPPPQRLAQVAGWGYIDETNYKSSRWLHYIKQRIWTLIECRATLRSVPDGCICAGEKRSNTFVSKGDSGSALVVNGYIQIGIVSFKRPDYSRSLAVYTDVSYFFAWIEKSAKKLACL